MKTINLNSLKRKKQLSFLFRRKSKSKSNFTFLITLLALLFSGGVFSQDCTIPDYDANNSSGCNVTVIDADNNGSSVGANGNGDCTPCTENADGQFCSIFYINVACGADAIIPNGDCAIVGLTPSTGGTYNIYPGDLNAATSCPPEEALDLANNEEAILDLPIDDNGFIAITVCSEDGGGNRSFDLMVTPCCELTVDGTTTNPTCAGDSDGSITFVPAGGTPPYSWSYGNGPGESGDGLEITGLSAGTYSGTFMDGNGCEASFSETLTDPPGFEILCSTNKMNPSCFGGSDGSLVAVLSISTSIPIDGGGDFPIDGFPIGGDGLPTLGTATIVSTAVSNEPTYTYSYKWTNADDETISMEASASGLPAGTYTVEVTQLVDGVPGCVKTCSATLEDPTPSIMCPPDLGLPPDVSPELEPDAIACGDTDAINAWLNDFTLTNVCENATVVNDYKADDFDKCQETTKMIRFMVMFEGQIIAECVSNLKIAAAPTSMFMDPVYPSSIECADVADFMAIPVMYTNSVDDGPCKIMGVINGTVNYENYTEGCGGYLLIDYDGEDECGTPYMEQFRVDVNAAPTPELMPNLPDYLTCDQAATFMAPDAMYSNAPHFGSGSGNNPCLIEGTLEGSISDNSYWNECEGGTITVVYSGEDKCGNDLSETYDIPVWAAPDAHLIIPTPPLAPPLSCSQAETFTAPPAFYSNQSLGGPIYNGQIDAIWVTDLSEAHSTMIQNCVDSEAPNGVADQAGFIDILTPYLPPYYGGGNGNNNQDCVNEGILPPLVIPLWNKCSGGIIIVAYLGYDDCGELLIGARIRLVLPAPTPEITIPEFDDMNLTCMEASMFTSVPDLTFSNAGLLEGLHGGGLIWDDGSLSNTITTTTTNGITGLPGLGYPNMGCLCEGSIPGEIDPDWDQCEGGSITVTWDGYDCCQRRIFVQKTFHVAPSELPELTLPELPDMLSCDEATMFNSVPDATFTNMDADVIHSLINGSDDTSWDNGDDMPCLCEGTIEGTIIPAFDVCGGKITVLYSGYDCCQRPISGMKEIPVDRAPAPEIMVPELPESISCAVADAGYSVPSTMYTNDLVGTCAITGTVAGEVIATNFDKCGGYIMVEWRVPSSVNCDDGDIVETAMITVDRAPAPEIMIPELPESISCAVADAGYSVPSTMYTNDLVGTCAITGTVAGEVIATNFDKCGGYIMVEWRVPSSANCDDGDIVETAMIDVDKAPMATVSYPTLADPITCEMAIGYTAPPATYTNDLNGVCEISGMIHPIITPNWDKCGGTITVTYLGGNDPCGRPLGDKTYEIEVLPAPVPTVYEPNLPDVITCQESEHFVAPWVVYDNGAAHPCRIYGTIPPQVYKDVDLCDGGYITVDYAEYDECGNYLSLETKTIIVEPASIPELEAHPGCFITQLTCYEASRPEFLPGNATFDNGETGACRNAGEIEPDFQYYLDDCGGGVIFVSYSGYDNCGRPLSAGPFSLHVLPDTDAPWGECPDAEHIVGSLDHVPGPDMLDDYKYYIASHFEDCSDIVVTVVGDSGEQDCKLDGTFERVYEMQIADVCGNIADTCTLTFRGNCGPPYCSLLQNFYANDDQYPDSLYGYSSLEILDSLMGFGANPITVGVGDCGFTVSDATCVATALAGHGESIALTDDYVFDCGSPLNNVLVNQVITLELNIRFNVLFNTEGPLDLGNYELSALAMSIPNIFLNAMPDNPTVNDLLDYANDFIGCVCAGTCEDYNTNMAILTSTILGLNSIFQFCFEPGSFAFAPEEEEEEEEVPPVEEEGYCESYGESTEFEYIKSVTINGIDNESGNNGGYADYTGMTGIVYRNQSQVIILKPGFTEFSSNQYWRVWVDWNQDGDFDDVGELEVEDQGWGGIWSNVSVPAEALLGTTQMRISMSSDGYPGSCDIIEYGEVEDYTLEVLEDFKLKLTQNNSNDLSSGASQKTTNVDLNGANDFGLNLGNSTQKMDVNLYPNPTKDFINLELSSGFGKSCFIEIFDAQGKKIGDQSFTPLMESSLQLDVHKYSSGLYWISIQVDGFDQVTKKFIVRN